MTITPLPPAPSRQDPANFSGVADTFLGSLPALVTDINAELPIINAAVESAPAAVAAANYKGAWSLLTGTLAIPASVLHNGELWFLTESVADVTLVEPSIAPEWLLIGGASGPEPATHNFVASGTISNGNLVGINFDGTVSALSNTLGDATLLSTDAASDAAGVFDSSANKVVFAYQNGGNSNFGTAVVGTVSGTSISFGTPVVFESASIEHTAITFDSTNNKVIIAYRDNGNSSFGTVVVGTVSGTSISFGTPVVFAAVNVEPSVSATYDATNGKVVIAYKDNANAGSGTAVVGTVSGTSISFGTPVVFKSSSTNAISSTHDPDTSKVIFSYRDSVGSGASVVGTVSGTSISFGTPVVFDAGSIGVTYGTSTVYDTVSNKIVVSYVESGKAYAIVGTVSGTSISFGSRLNLPASGSVGRISSAFDLSSGRVSSTFNTATEVRLATFSITSSSIEKVIVVTTSNLNGTNYTPTVYDAANEKVVFLFTQGTSNSGDTLTKVVDGSALVPFNNWIGISSESVTNGQPVNVQVVSAKNSGQSGLSIGSKYYLGNDGTISTASAFGREIGIAVSATDLIITQGGIEV